MLGCIGCQTRVHDLRLAYDVENKGQIGRPPGCVTAEFQGHHKDSMVCAVAGDGSSLESVTRLALVKAPAKGAGANAS